MAKEDKSKIINKIDEIQKLMDYVDKHACSECKHLEINIKETVDLSKNNRRFDGDKKISEVMAKCTKKANSKTVKIIEFKVYKGTGTCFNSKYLDYEINK